MPPKPDNTVPHGVNPIGATPTVATLKVATPKVNTRTVAQFVLFLATLGLYIFMICLIYFNTDSIKIHEHMSRSLHALEYPATSSQLSLVSFRTPGLPTRLASTWEIQNELHMTPDTLASVYDMIYPTMQQTIGMHEQLREHTPANCIACDAQGVFSFRNRLTERQTQHYCPLRGEKMSQFI